MSRQEDAFSGCLATRLGMMSFPPPHTHTQYSSTLGHAWSRASTRVSGHAEPHVRGGGCCPVRLRGTWGTQAPAADDAALSQPSWLGEHGVSAGAKLVPVALACLALMSRAS